MFAVVLPDTLQSIGLNSSDLDILAGQPVCPNLTGLDIDRCQNLRSPARLRVRFPALKYLTLTACGRLTASKAKRALAGHQRIRQAVQGGQVLFGV
jgi:hypothetical protein